jgi:hypothetical protein
MKPLWHKLLSASLLAPTLAVGCRHVERSADCAACHARAPVASVVAAPAATMDAGGYNTVQAHPVMSNLGQPELRGLQPGYNSVRAHPVMSIPAAEPVVSAPPAVLPMVPAPMPVVAAPTTAEVETPPSRTAEPQRMPTGGTPAVVRNAGPMDRPQTSVSMKVVDLPSTAIGAPDAKTGPAAVPSPAPAYATSVATAHPLGYAHALDYSMLVGELNYNPRQGTWRLRYTTVDDEDRYGGSVTLVGADPMLHDYKSGQVVRVHGSLADPDSRLPSPAYRVTEVEAAGSAR